MGEKGKKIARPREGKVHQGNKEKLARLEREKAQEVKRVEEGEAACSVKGKAQQEEWKRSSWEVLRKRAKWYCELTVPQDAELWELG